MCELTALQSLTVSRCFALASLPAALCQLEQLRSLRLFACPSLDALPEDLGSCKQLETLVLRGCSRVTRLPSSMRFLSSLRHLELRNCPSLSSPPWLGEMKVTRFCHDEPVMEEVSWGGVLSACLCCCASSYKACMHACMQVACERKQQCGASCNAGAPHRPVRACNFQAAVYASLDAGVKPFPMQSTPLLMLPGQLQETAKCTDMHCRA